EIMKRFGYIIIMGVLGCIMLAGCGQSGGDGGGDQAGGPVIETEEDKEANTIFQANCISCHATDLSGNMGQKSNLQQVGSRLSQEEIANAITEGRPPIMQPFADKLAASEI